MSKPRKETRRLLYDQFRDWNPEDREAALAALEEIHRTLLHVERRGKVEPEQPSLLDGQAAK